MPQLFHSGAASVAFCLSGPFSFCDVQFVTRCRIMFKPVFSETRVGVQTVHAYACVNFIPLAASFSMFGVWNFSLIGVRFVQKGTEVSCQPMSSTRKTTMLGG